MKEIEKIIQIIKKKHSSSKSNDTVWAITGKERVGKSHLALHILTKYDPEAKIYQVAFNIKDFIKGLYKSKPGDCVLFDEAGDGLYSRDWQKEENKDLSRLFFVIGAKRFFTLLVMPNFFMLDKTFREHRVKALFYVWKTGRVKIYDQYGIQHILAMGKNYIPRQVKFIGDDYPLYKGHLLQEYDEKKAGKVDDSLRDMYEKYCEDKGNIISLEKACKLLQINRVTLKRAAKLSEITIPVNVVGQYQIDENTLEQLRKSLENLNEKRPLPI